MDEQKIAAIVSSEIMDQNMVGETFPPVTSEELKKEGIEVIASDDVITVSKDNETAPAIPENLIIKPSDNSDIIKPHTSKDLSKMRRMAAALKKRSAVTKEMADSMKNRRKKDKRARYLLKKKKIKDGNKKHEEMIKCLKK